ncbi:MAG: DUF971 domain-containing protein [Blastocatellia bacterium]|nr:DUF971 domain-containing protein [Blastocatellia bacterium]MBL8193604.1 DUF971 domain-containing protein [Blastocatellia bacterium]MBN8723335.1 DUF971 domain-containing protein [Acidobacteriota bacterium]
MSTEIKRLPVEINASKNTGIIEIFWDDDHRTFYNLGQLRAICPCASCREAKGEKPHQAISAKAPAGSSEAKPKRSLPLFKAEKYSISGMHYVGNYALGVDWEDNHHSIFTWKLLSDECLCSDCAKERSLTNS